jgi:hypothetical protein
VDGKETFLLRHEGDWPAFEVSPDGSFLATKDKNDVICVWDLVAGTERLRATVPKASQITFAGKRDNLIVEAGGRLLRVLWRTDDLIEEACRRLTRKMTEEEWRRYMPTRTSPLERNLHQSQQPRQACGQGTKRLAQGEELPGLP